jgi:hypothetical protein
VRVDLEVSTVLVDAFVRDAKSGEPVASAGIHLEPEGAECRASMSMRSFGNLFETDLDVSVSDGGCAFGSTFSDGRVRLSVGAPGPYGLLANAKRYEPIERRVDLQPGSNPLVLELTPAAGPRVRVTMHSDPPGLPGTLECVTGGGSSRHSYGGVSGSQECPLGPGPAEAIFRIDGFGIGRTEFVVPDEGDLEVTVTAVRCGQLLVGRLPGSSGTPVVLDAAGTDWGAVLSRTGGGALQATETAELGDAWLLRYLPPGAYTVELDGRPKGTAVVEAGGLVTLP